MSDFDSNPFADPQGSNPFQDPAVRQATQNQGPALEEYNPFADQGTQQVANTAQPRATTQAPAPQPAVMQATQEQPPPPYTPSPAQQATDDLQRRQEELERKAAELQRKEQEMNNMQQYGTRQNNFPPLPDKCCVKPCFYQDFTVDIPIEFQKIVKTIYYVWLFYVCVLFLNVLGCLAYFIASVQANANNSSGVTFGLSILYLVLFTPCSFVCWYRPLYKAFRSDSSFNFFVFFFIFFFQFCVTVLQCLGIDGWGTCGWISALSIIGKNVAAGVIMMIIAVLFTGLAVVVLILLIKVHRIYRSTGASFEKAQQEFAQGVMTNKTVQNTASQAAGAAARGAFQPQPGDNRY